MATSSARAALPSVVRARPCRGRVSIAIRRRGALSPSAGTPRQPPSTQRPWAIAEPASPNPSSAITPRRESHVVDPEVRVGKAGASPSLLLRAACVSRGRGDPKHGAGRRRASGRMGALGDAGDRAGLPDSMTLTPAKRPSQRWPNRSTARGHAHQEPRVGRRHAEAQCRRSGANMLARSERGELARRIGMALIEGESGRFATKSRRVSGATTIMRPPSDMTRQISRSIGRELLGALDGVDQQHAVDRTERSGSGRSSSSTRVACVAAFAWPARDALLGRHEAPRFGWPPRRTGAAAASA